MTTKKGAGLVKDILVLGKAKQVDLAKALGVAPSTVSHWLIGKGAPKSGNLRALREIYTELVASRVAGEYATKAPVVTEITPYEEDLATIQVLLYSYGKLSVRARSAISSLFSV